jgi:hypothetical protein
LSLQRLGISSLLVLALVSGCGPSSESLDRARREALLLNEVRQYYAGGEITAGTFDQWKVISVSASEENPFSEKIASVTVHLQMPADKSADIMSRSSDGQHRAVGWNACPPRSHPMWRKFTGNDFLTISAGGPAGIFIDVDCKQWAQ